MATDTERIDNAFARQLFSPDLETIPDSWIKDFLTQIIPVLDETINDELDYLFLAEDLDYNNIMGIMYEDDTHADTHSRNIDEAVDRFCTEFFKSEKYNRIAREFITEANTKIIDKGVLKIISEAGQKILKQMEDRPHWHIFFNRALGRLTFNIFKKLLTDLVVRCDTLMEDDSSTSRLDAILELVSQHISEAVSKRGNQKTVYHDILCGILRSRQIDLALMFTPEQDITALELKALDSNDEILELIHSKNIYNAIYTNKSFELRINTMSGKSSDTITDPARLCFGTLRINKDFAKRLKMISTRYLIGSLGAQLMSSEAIDDDDTESRGDEELHLALELNDAYKEITHFGLEFVYNAITGEVEFPMLPVSLRNLEVLSPLHYAMIKSFIAHVIVRNLKESPFKASPRVTITREEIIANIDAVFAANPVSTEKTAVDHTEIYKPIEVTQEESDIPNVENSNNCLEDVNNIDTPPNNDQLPKIKIPKIPRGITANRFHAFLLKTVGEPIRTTGKHQIYQRKIPNTEEYYGKPCAVPYHGASQAFGVGLIVSILNSLEIPREKFIAEI